MPKTYKNLYAQIIEFDNLLAAYERARRGKQQTAEMYAFHFDLEQNLWALHEELRDGDYQPGAYHSFYIYEPKKRKVSAAPFRDRIVHHALCAVIQPFFERKFIHDSYANRVDKGTHRALDRAHDWVRRYRSHKSHDFSLRPPRLRVRLFLKSGLVANSPYGVGYFRGGLCLNYCSWMYLTSCIKG